MRKPGKADSGRASCRGRAHREGPRPGMTARQAPGPDGKAPRSRGNSAFARLLEVQFWLLGRDVEHPDGNLLLRLGFTRQPAPDHPWPSRYLREDAAGYAVIWRCGIFLDAPRHGCLLLRAMAPATVSRARVDDLYDLDEVARLQRQGGPCRPGALTGAARWFAGYEASVTTTAGLAHRVPRPGSAPLLAPPEPCSLEERWQAVAAQLETLAPRTAASAAARSAP